MPHIDQPRTLTLMNPDGTRPEYTLTHADALKFAKAAAKEFGIGKDQEVLFDKDLAVKDWKGEGDTKATAKALAKKAATEAKRLAAESSAITQVPVGD